MLSIESIKSSQLSSSWSDLKPFSQASIKSSLWSFQSSISSISSLLNDELTIR